MSCQRRGCNTCGVMKEPADFSKNPQTKTGLRTNCRACESSGQQVRDRAKRTGSLSVLPTQPSAEAHRVWMRVSAGWAKAVAA